MREPKYEMRFVLRGDDWPSIQRRMAGVLARILETVPRGEVHLTGSDDRGVTYTVDVLPGVALEPPVKVRA